MRVVFCGNPDFALPTLQALHDSRHEIAAVVCSPDKPMGRGKKLGSPPVKNKAAQLGLEVLQPESLKDSGFLQTVQALKPDALVVVAFRILPRTLFTLPLHGALNVHPSLLPKARGAAPIQWTLIRGEQETGVTIIRLTEHIDAGNVLRQESVPIAPEDDFGTLHDSLAELGARLLVETLDAIEDETQPAPLKQNDAQTTTAPKLKPEDFVLNWEQNAEDLLNRIRAFSPVPGAVSRMEGKRIKIYRAEIAANEPELLPGQLRSNNEGLFVGTGSVPLRIIEVQFEGRKKMSVGEFLRGYRISDETRFEMGG
ncbi:methionyl-tRNA formyltransferase [bacterium]|nr:methionyl-tRNA formyltransferase [bacterium]